MFFLTAFSDFIEILFVTNHVFLFQNFSSTETSGNVTLRRLGMEYHVQVSATVFDSASRFNRESLFSSLTPTSILFVPTQGSKIKYYQLAY